MGESRRRRLFAVLAAVLEHPIDSRSAALEELCGGDASLRCEVESLLALEAEAERAFVEPAVRLPGDPEHESAPAELRPGSRLGSYRIVELLGRGGMGAVYRATREDVFEKRVAIKLMRRDLLAASAHRRFEIERQILARFEHPGIARLLDGGTTPEGHPYLVMEYVEGSAIDVFCDEQGLTVRQRLELFHQVLEAVAYAHRNLVVHRDLKPGNVLVTPEGQARLVDFGIAKLLGEAGASVALTRLGDESPMTPRYASPEQLLGEPITTASDVFSLGVLLYQLLTGRHPWWSKGVSMLELARGICELDPPPPSTAAQGRGLADPRASRALGRALAGDIDAIVLEALRKKPGDRYSRVEELDQDLVRHLEGLPVRARRGAWAYRAGRLLRRYRAAVALVVLLVVSAASATGLWLRAEVERRRADRERAEAVAARERKERVAGFLGDLFR
ncbi:MAG: serine/threonine protein kinase, partial [Holophagales bacterium]|nr:serine/threonine protein kinase [Holophagales bacterium]